MPGLFSGGGSAASEAASIQAAAAQRAAQLQYDMFQQARQDVSPWLSAGGAALNQLTGLYLPGYSMPGTTAGTAAGGTGTPSTYGLGGTTSAGVTPSPAATTGYTYQDPTQVLMNTPGYQWTMNQGIDALTRSAAARGLNLSGAQLKGITDYGQNLAINKAWAPYVSQLNTLSSGGLGAGTQTGNWGMQTGQIMGQDYMTAANAQAQGLYNQYYANRAQNQAWGNLFGMGAGLLYDFLM